MRITTKKAAISFLMLFIAVTSEILFDTTSEKAIALVPVLFFIVAFFLCMDIRTLVDSNVGFCLYMLLFIRLYLLPVLIISDGDYLRNIPLNYGLSNAYYFTQGVLLTVYEAVFVYAYIQFRVVKLTSSSQIRNVNQLFKTNNFFLWVFILLFFVITILYPQVYSERHFVLALLRSEPTIIQEQFRSTSLIATVATISLRNIFLLLPIPIMSWIYFTRHKNWKESNARYYLFIVVSFCGYSLFIEGTSRISVIVPLCTVIFVSNNLFPQYKRKTFRMGIVVLGVLVAFTTVWKFYVSRNIAFSIDLDDFVETLELYFAGFSNMGKAWIAKSESGLLLPQIRFFLNDLFANVPIINRFTSSTWSASQYFVKVFSGRNDQIMPAIGNGMFYFGLLLSPIVSFIQIEVALWFERHAKTAFSFPKYVVFTYASIMLIYGCFGSIQIFMQKLSINVLLAAIIVSINEKRLK